MTRLEIEKAVLKEYPHLSKSNQMVIIAHRRGYRVNRYGVLYNLREAPIKQGIRKGYCNVTLRIGQRGENQVVKLMVHKLVAYQQFGEKMFEKGIEVRHLNGNSLDNSWKNIDIGTRSDNAMDKPREVRIKVARYAASKTKNAKSPEMVAAIIEDRNKGLTYKELADKYKMSKGTLSYYFNPIKGIYK